ncbi:MAG: nitrate reductase cytochrome c-type subunit [Fuerstiella sp.]
MTTDMPQPEPSETTPVTSTPERGLSLFGAIVVGIALVGYLLGITEGNKPITPIATRARGAGDRNDVRAAAPYAAMPETDFSPNAGWSSQLQNLKYERPSRLQAVNRTDDMKLAAIADRAKNRAYDGAPPVIPHRVEQQTAASCLVCHGEGLKLGDRIATRISHAHFTSCTQCHVEAESSGPFPVPEATENTFVGLYRAGPGSRALAGAPPTIPHTTWLREDCMSCHGTIAREGLRTTHPWFTNCTQCHAPSAELDQTGLWMSTAIDRPADTAAGEPVITPKGNLSSAAAGGPFATRPD